VPTADERTEQANQRAEQAIQQAEQANQQVAIERDRADRLAEQLRALGVDPNEII
jgi:hypothetical protein